MLAANPCLAPADVTRLLKAAATASVTGAPAGTTNLAVNARAAVAAAAAEASATCGAAGPAAPAPVPMPTPAPATTTTTTTTTTTDATGSPGNSTDDGSSDDSGDAPAGGGRPSFVTPGGGVPSFVIPGSGIVPGVAPGNSGNTPAAVTASNAAAVGAAATAATEAAQSGDSQAVADFVASVSYFAQSLAAAAAAGNSAGGGGASPAAAGAGAPAAATVNATVAANNAAAVSNAAMALLTAASLLNQNVPISQTASGMAAQSQQQASAGGAAPPAPPPPTGIAPDPNGGSPFLAAAAQLNARVTLLAALADTLSSAGAPAGSDDMLSVASAIGAIVAATQFVSPAGATSALSSLAVLAAAPAAVLNASSLAPVAHALGGIIGAANGFANAGDASAAYWDAGYVLDTLARAQGAALAPGASQSVASEQFSLLMRTDLPNNATSTLFTRGLSLPLAANTTIPVAVDPLPAGIFAGATGAVATTLLSMAFNPWAASDAASGVTSVTRISFAAAGGGADMSVANLANALTFSMPSGATSPLAATNASLQAACVFYNTSTSRYDSAGCITRPPVYPAGHTLAWSATTGLASDADLARAWSIRDGGRSRLAARTPSSTAPRRQAARRACR
jgi:hypothetical protein